MERWYKEAVVYCLDVETFQDSNSDGIGDLPGLISRLDYISRVGASCIWLNPIHPSPGKDDGYDVVDYYAVSPHIGSLGDFAELVHEAANRGIRVIIDLVINHTSDQHPWFQQARKDPRSPFRDWYVWSKTEPPDRFQGMVFPGQQKETWSFDEEAEAWYYHRFYDFEPNLNHANPRVRAEMKKIMGFWLQLGVAGFRMDAAPFVIEIHEAGNLSTHDFDLLTELTDHARWRRGDTLILAEANVDSDQLPQYFGDIGGSGNRLPMLFDFQMNGKLMLALARADVEPIVQTMLTTPKLPHTSQWATFLRNHDEVDLSRLTDHERADVFAEFGPNPDMQLYGRGIRRRLAPMLGNDRARLEMAYSLQFTLPGTPVIRYGEEIGMGDDLTLKERDAIRTPMQWFAGANGGFSGAPPKKLIRPVIDGGDYGYQTVNVTAQRRDPHSLLSWFERMIRTLRECPEIGGGHSSLVEAKLPESILAHRFDGFDGALLLLHNLGKKKTTLDLGPQPGVGADLHEVFSNRAYPAPNEDLEGLELDPYGYRWIRLRHDIQHRGDQAGERGSVNRRTAVRR
jgi:maltose alpha-D-glucosyltransferase / alpha-amylase